MAIAGPTVANPAQVAAAARAALTEAMVLKVGQVLQALVAGKTADGLTVLKIGDRVLTAKLPQLDLPAGSTLQLQVKVGGSAPQLQLVGTPAPAATARPPLTPTGSPLAAQSNAQQVAVAEHPQLPPTQPMAAASTRPEGTAPAAIMESGQGSAPKPSEIESRSALPTTALRASPMPVEDAVARSAVATMASGGVAEGTPVSKVASPSPLLVGTPISGNSAAGAIAAAAPSFATIEKTILPPVETQSSPPAARSPFGTSIVASPAAERISAEAAAVAHAPVPSVTTASTADIAAEPSEPAAAHSLLVAQSAPRLQASVADLPRMVAAVLAPTSPLPAPGGPQQAAAPPSTPQAALTQMLPEALSRQDSPAPLLLSLAAAVQKPGLLPEPIVRAALGLLAQRVIVTDGKVQAGQIEQAVLRSGVTLEASLLRAEPQPRDAKAGLLALRDALAKWLGGAPAPPATGRDAAPPPIKGLPLRAAPAEPPPPLPDTPRDVGRLLHGEADAAVSRLKLMQLASLPDADTGKPAPLLRTELPFLIGHELVMAQIQVGRDGARREAERKRGWTMRFALNFSATGEVGAEVGVLGKAVSVSLWAAEPETAAAITENLPELTQALEAVGLRPGVIRMRQGVPSEPSRPQSGRLLDSVS